MRTQHYEDTCYTLINLQLLSERLGKSDKIICSSHVNREEEPENSGGKMELC